MSKVSILNPWDAQGVQIADGVGIYPCVRGCGGGGYQQGYVLQHIDGTERELCEVKTGGKIIVLNDQGGSVMNVSNIPATLRAESHQHEPVICFEPGIAKREGSDSRFVTDMCGTLRAEMGDNQPAVCYAIEGNVVDRVSAKNGKGWCEGVSPTLNTQDRHAVCFQLCGDRDNPSVSISETAFCIPANPMSDRGQAICYKK